MKQKIQQDEDRIKRKKNLNICYVVSVLIHWRGITNFMVILSYVLVLIIIYPRMLLNIFCPLY